MNTTQSSPEEKMALILIGILERRNPARTGEEALKRLGKMIRSDCGCMSTRLVEIRYRAIAVEAGIDQEEVAGLVCSLCQIPKLPASGQQALLKALQNVST